MTDVEYEACLGGFGQFVESTEMEGLDHGTHR
jgi:hypothetical protein